MRVAIVYDDPKESYAIIEPSLINRYGLDRQSSDKHINLINALSAALLTVIDELIEQNPATQHKSFAARSHLQLVAVYAREATVRHEDSTRVQ